MKNWIKTALAMVMLTFPISYAHAWDLKSMNTQVDQTNFLVNDNCSATLIDPKEGLLLTANHCIEDQFQIIKKQEVAPDGTVKTKKVRVTVPGTVSQIAFNGPDQISKISYSFTVVKNDKDIDLALIKTVGKLSNTEGAPLACSVPVRGTTTYAVGNPMGSLFSTVSKGILSSVHRNYRMIGVDSDKGLLQTTSPIGGGNSGGALYNDNGEIIGVNVRGYQQVAPLGFSVPLWDIRSFLKDVKPDFWAHCTK